jgi:hypothetical protein
MYRSCPVAAGSHDLGLYEMIRRRCMLIVVIDAGHEGLCYTPLSTRQHYRTGTRERVLAVAARFPDRPRIETDALATRVVLDAGARVIGVEYRKGVRLYRAHAAPGTAVVTSSWLVASSTRRNF